MGKTNPPKILLLLLVSQIFRQEPGVRPEADEDEDR